VGARWDWHRVAPELRERGHDPVAVDLPSEDDSAGWSEYTDTVVREVGDRSDLIVVGHSLGGFTAPLVCARVPVELLVLAAAMIPSPGETFADWWEEHRLRGERVRRRLLPRRLSRSRSRGEAPITTRGGEGISRAVAARGVARDPD
jgi:pimeloyl-ACP methyl ester carboxylesterase